MKPAAAALAALAVAAALSANAAASTSDPYPDRANDDDSPPFRSSGRARTLRTPSASRSRSQSHGRRVQTSATTTVTYPPALPLTSPLPNPERGLYWQVNYYASAAGAGAGAQHQQRLSASTLRNQQESTGMTLLLRLYYLDSFIASDISQDVLDDISADFGTMRDAGVKCVLRFAYVDNNLDPTATTEPAKPQLLAHIAQLAPVLAGGEDVILSVQAGFLGPWGEWHSSTHFDDDEEGRKEVTAALLDAVPGGKIVQIRTPRHKKDLYVEYDYPTPTGGYLSDRGFEAGATAAWGPYMDGFAVDSTIVKNGGKSIEVTNGGARQWVSLNPPAPAGHRVRISGYSYGVDTPPGIGSSYSVYADVALVDDATGQSSYLWGETADFLTGGTATDWEFAEHEFEVPEGKSVVGMTIYAMYRYQAQGTAYFDDIDVLVFAPPVQSGGQVLDPTTAHEGTDVSRTGHHNDCFLASDTDFGTYADASQAEYAYLSDETKYTAMGGETCNMSPPRSECATAKAEMELFHYTYLNSGYHQDVLASWDSGGCMDEVKAKLGYRLVLQDGTYPNTAAPGTVVPFSIDLRNEGWAAPVNGRRVQLVLKHAATAALCAATFDSAALDVRTWYGGESHALSGEAALPADIPPGQYSLHLHVTDPSPALRTEMAYKTKVANDGGTINDPSTGLIDLGHAVDVAAGNPSSLGGSGPRIAVACGAEADILPPSAPSSSAPTPAPTSSLAVDPDSLVENGSFEGDVAAAWSSYGAGFSIETDADLVHSGSQAVRVTDGAARQVVTLDAPAGSVIKVSGYSKSSGVSAGLWNDYSVYTDVVYADGGGYLWGQCARFAGGTPGGAAGDWEYAEWTFTAVKDVSYLTLYAMYRNDPAGGGTAWFDDVSVAVTPPPSAR